MSEFSELETRIDHLRSRAASGPLTPELAAEIESVLAEGYVSALRADARSLRLREQVDALAGELDAPRLAEELGRLGRERRILEQSARGLRERLATLRSLLLRAAGPRTRSA